MKKYDNMKDSRIKWIGEIPEHWKTAKLKFVADIKGGSTPKTKIKEYWDGEIDWFTPADLNANESIKELNHAERKISKIGLRQSGCNLIPSGNVFVTNRAPIGGIAFVTTDFATNQGCKSVVTKPQLQSKFLFYLLASAKQELKSLGNGATFKELSTQSLKSILIPYCDRSEQTQIVSFLDKKTGKIDLLIANKERKIKLLKEKRKALINQAVTKGLNPDATMKESGIDWIGEIPEGWKVKKLHHISYVRPSNVDKHIHEDEIQVKLCNYTDVYYNEKISEISDFENGSVTDKEYEKFIVRKNDVILTKDYESSDDIGIPTYISDEIENVVCGYHLTQITPDEKYCLGEFVFRFIQSDKVRSFFEIEANGITRFGLSKATIEKLQIPLPSTNEQKRIIEYITSEIDKLINKEKDKIDLLKEFRQSLIAEVVTGKIDIRDEENTVSANGQVAV